ncbi:MAG: MoaD family protein [Chloroflexi bacterium]|nr:MoaD family protein [Chloroflexota bacterium]
MAASTAREEVSVEIKVRLFAALREAAGSHEVAVDLEEGADVAQLLQRIQARYPALAGRCAGTVVAVNTEYAGPETRIRPGDDVALIPPVSGGAVAHRATARITTAPLDAAAIAASLRRPANGAVVTFEGIVRDNNLGRRVLYLEYEAYQEMAEKVLREIGERVCASFGLEEIALGHRVGRLEIGETSLVVAVAAPHREEAFAACREAVEQVKSLAPIWKREVWEGGAQWLGGAG